MSWHSEFGPHGDGSQAFLLGFSGSAVKTIVICSCAFLLTIFLRLSLQRAVIVQLTRLRIASNKRVSLIVLVAGANGSVVHRFTPGVLSAGLFTRVRTSVLDAGAVHRAVRM